MMSNRYHVHRHEKNQSIRYMMYKMSHEHGILKQIAMMLQAVAGNALIDIIQKIDYHVQGIHK